MIEQNKKIIEQQENILKKMENTENEQGKITENRLYEPLQGFPLRTIDEFEDLDSKENKSKRNKLVSIFLYVRDSKSFMKALF